MLTIKGQEFPISDEAYEMVLRAVDAEGFDPCMSGWALDCDGWVEARIVCVCHRKDVGYSVRFMEMGGLLSYEFWNQAQCERRFTRRVLSMAELHGIPSVPMTVSFQRGRHGQLLTKIQHNDGRTEVQID